jgi:hypothetical protein
MSSDEDIQLAINAATSGDKASARKILSSVIKSEPNNARAWYLLSQTVEKSEEAIFCLERALHIQPQNEQIKQRLENIKSGGEQDASTKLQPPLSSESSSVHAIQKNKQPTTQLMITAGVFAVLMVFICIIVYVITKLNQQSKPIVVAVEEPPTASPTLVKGYGEKCYPPPIPGIIYRDIINHLAEKGIDCNAMKRDAIAYSASCNGEFNYGDNGLISVDVEIYSTENPDEPYLILTSVYQQGQDPSTEAEIEKQILGYVAMLSYKNSEPILAKQWVEKNIPWKPGPEPVAWFGNVRFHIAGPGVLAIGQGSGSGWNYDCK